MSEHWAKCVNREALELYREDLSLERIMIFEYFADIARFSPSGIFKIRKSTLASKLRLNRRKIDSLIDWLIQVKLIIEKPRKSQKDPRCYYFDFHQLKKNPSIIFKDGIPFTPQYEVLSKRVRSNRRLEIFKRKEK